MNNPSKMYSCGCWIEDGQDIIFCPLHAHAGEMLEALRDLIADYERLAFPEDDPVVNRRRRKRANKVRAVIAKAEGGKE